MQALYQPLRTAAAIARGRLALTVAADQLGRGRAVEAEGRATARSRAGGRSLGYGELVARRRGRQKTRRARKVPSPSASRSACVVGKGQRRVDGRDIVTGRKKYAMDLDVKNALPTMLCRPPTINGHAEAVAEPGAREGDARRHRRGPDPPAPTTSAPAGAGRRGRACPHVRAVHRRDPRDEGALVGRVGRRARTPTPCSPTCARRRAAADARHPRHPGAAPGQGAAPKQVEEEFIFHFRPGDPLEPNTAVADVRKPTGPRCGRRLKSPIWFQERVAASLGLPLDKVNVHVTQGGGSFGRRLFSDAPFEAAWHVQGDRQAGAADVAPGRHRRARAGRTRWPSRACALTHTARTRSWRASSATPACRPTSPRAWARC